MQIRYYKAVPFVTREDKVYFSVLPGSKLFPFFSKYQSRNSGSTGKNPKNNVVWKRQFARQFFSENRSLIDESALLSISPFRRFVITMLYSCWHTAYRYLTTLFRVVNNLFVVEANEKSYF